jgi:hypothetical protein
MLTRASFKALALAGVCALSLASVAAASPGKPLPGPAPAVSTDSVPPGYTQVHSGLLPAADQAQTRGSATCPAGTVPLGGGVFVLSQSTLANVNSSFPTANGWIADVNNASGAATSFEVSVICGLQPKHYSIVQSDQVLNPAASHTTGAATCPIGSKPLGGGALSNSSSTFVNLNSTFPKGSSWRVAENNSTTTDKSFSVFAVCGKLAGYQVLQGLDLPTPGGAQSLVSVTCPDSQLAISGGALSSSSSIGVNLNGSTIDGRNWNSWINNSTAVNATARPIVVCAGT